MKIPILFASLGVLSSLVHAQETPVTNVHPAPANAPHLPTLWLIGDSTVRNGTKGQQGWGDPIKDLFDPAKIHVENRARGGRSSRTFLTEGLWDAVLKDMQAGDFVLMQFGHNDGGSVDGAKATGRASIKGNGDDIKTLTAADGKTEDVHSYGWYLRRYVSDTKAKGASPIVLSLIPRNDWADGKVGRSNLGYGLWAREAAAAEGVPFLDLNSIVADHYDAMGQEKVAAFFPNEHTHTNPDGALLNAQSVAEGLRAMPESPLGTYLKPVTP